MQSFTKYRADEVGEDWKSCVHNSLVLEKSLVLYSNHLNLFTGSAKTSYAKTIDFPQV